MVTSVRRASRPRRTVTAAAAAALAAGALVVAGLTGSASAGTGSPDRDSASASAHASDGSSARTAAENASPALLTAMSKDLGLTRGEARTRLGNEAEAAATAAGLRKALGADYAGARLSGDTAHRLTVSTTDPADTARITAAGATARVVDRGLAELNRVKKALDRTAGKAGTKGVSVWYVDVKDNRVVVEASRDSAARSFLDRAGVDRADVAVRHSAAKPRPYADVRGGDAYYIGGASRCSVGFSVTGGGGQGGFVTAGHCGRTGATTTGADQQPQGTFQGSTFPGYDYAWVAVNSNWTPTPKVNGYGQGDVTVAGSTEQVEGASVCRSGSTSGWHCGTVQQRGTSVTYPEGTINGVTQTTVCAEPGDSGGSYISGSQAQGVTSGGSGDCTSGGTTFFFPVNPILQAYGLTLTTSGG